MDVNEELLNEIIEVYHAFYGQVKTQGTDREYEVVAAMLTLAYFSVLPT